MNEFHPIPPCTKNPRFLNADIRKVQSRGNARAHVFKVRLISPAIVTKMRGAEAISAAASSASRCSETRGSVRFELAAHAKRKVNKKRGRAGGPNFEPEHPLARSDILRCLHQMTVYVRSDELLLTYMANTMAKRACPCSATMRKSVC